MKTGVENNPYQRRSNPNGRESLRRLGLRGRFRCWALVLGSRFQLKPVNRNDLRLCAAGLSLIRQLMTVVVR